MREIKTDIEIETSPEALWSILTDFRAYPEWNPYMVKIEGPLEVGKHLKVDMVFAGQAAMLFQPTIRLIEEKSAIHWSGKLWGMGFLFRGKHCLEIEVLDDKRVKFTQAEQFTGWLVPLVWKAIGPATRQAFIEMNEALKKRALSFNKQGK